MEVLACHFPGGVQREDVHICISPNFQNLLTGLLQAQLLRGEAFSGPRLQVNDVGRSPGSVLFKSLRRGTGAPVTARRETDFALGGAHLEDGLAVGAGQERLDQTLLHPTLEVVEGLCALVVQRVEDGGGSPCPSAFLSPPSWRWTSQLLQLQEDHTDGHFCDGPEVKGIQMAGVTLPETDSGLWYPLQ